MPDPLTRLPDGTVKQVNPFTGTKVWTLPGRGARPLGVVRGDPHPLDDGPRVDSTVRSASGRLIETTPEIARLVRDGDRWRELRGVLADDLDATVPEFRLFPNLFEILTFDYWHSAHGYEPTPVAQARRRAYLATPAGRDHVTDLARIRMRARGTRGADAEPLSPTDLGRESVGLFAGNHLVVVARRHFVDGATDDSQLASSGTLTPDEHHAYLAFTVRAMRDVYAANPFARYVSVFQNWLRPAGASFDHLHKQIVAIDELGAQVERESVAGAVRSRTSTSGGAQQYAARHGLVVAQHPQRDRVRGGRAPLPLARDPLAHRRTQPVGADRRRAARLLRPRARLPRGDGVGRAVQRGVAPPATVARPADAAAGRAQVAGVDPGRLRGRHEDLRQHPGPVGHP